MSPRPLARYLLDTGIAGAYLARDLDIRRRLKGGIFVISVIVAGELYFGAFNSRSQAENLSVLRAALDPWVKKRQLLLCNETTAERFGLIATDLQQRGLTIPNNDIWIAAQAMQYDLTVATRDEKHMSMIDGLRFEVW